MARTAIYLVILAAIAPYLYDRWQALSAMLANRPGKLEPVYNIKSHKIKFRDRVRNCEDVVLDEGMGIAILSCDPGRDRWNTVMGTFRAENGLESGALWLYDYSTPDLPDDEAMKRLQWANFPNEADFHPLGIEFDHATATLYAVNHAQSGSALEVFTIDVNTATATHIQTFKHPLLHAPNSIHALGAGKLFVTNDHFFRAAVAPLLSKLETWLAPPGGSVVFVDLERPQESRVVARVAFANGVAMLNKTTLAVASTSRAGVYFYEVEPDYSLKSKGFVRTLAAVDNLSVDSAGALLMAGHPSGLALISVAKNRWKCDAQSEKEDERLACGCQSPSWVAEWTESGGLRELYKGGEFCSSTMAVRDKARGVGFVSGLYERGVMVFRE